jgi:hypothetical protein
MALLKSKGYDGFEVDLGEEVEDVQKEQLKVSQAEMMKAINQENLTDRIFGRILQNRSKSHKALLETVPGATRDSE